VARRAVRVGQEFGNPFPDGRGVAVTRQEHQARHEPAVRLDRDEQADATTLLELQDAGRDLEQPVGVDLEQVVAWVVLEDGKQVLLVVAPGPETGAAHDGGDLAAHDRNVDRARHVRRRGVQAEEAVLADDVAVLVEALDSDVVEIRRAMNRRPRVRLRQHEELPFARFGARSRR
jgi:hypothetical protein